MDIMNNGKLRRISPDWEHPSSRSPWRIASMILIGAIFLGLSLLGLTSYSLHQIGELAVWRGDLHTLAEPDIDWSKPEGKAQYNSTVLWTEERQALYQQQRHRFHPGKPWLDEDGHLIQAHGGGVMFHDGKYYWFGENKGGQTYERESQAYHPPRVDVIGVSCYSSADLLHWKDEGLALRGGSHEDLMSGNVVERPKVLYHRPSGTFVMWMHVDTEDYEWARVGVAVSTSATGPYRFLRSWRPHNQHARDVTVFQDGDDSAYIAYSSEDNSVMHIARLNQDFQSIERRYKRILVGEKREAPAIFKFEEYFLMLTSGCTSWAPNRPAMFYTKEVMGEWQILGNPFSGGSELERAYSFFSQPTAVIQVENMTGRYVVMMDQWDTNDLGASRYAWLPMWIERFSKQQLDEGHAAWVRDFVEKRNAVNWMGFWFTMRPSPVHAVVHWLESWEPQILDRPLDPATRLEHLTELRTYPERQDGTFDVGQDALYGHRAKTV